MERNGNQKIVRIGFVTYIFNISVLSKLASLNEKIRRSRLEVFCKKDVLINLAKFTGKHVYQSLFFNKILRNF